MMVIWTIGGGILIGKSTEAGGFEWIKSHLCISWMIFLSFTTVFVLIQPFVWRFIVSTHEQWNNRYYYLLCFLIGGLIFCGYFYFADRTAKSASKKSSGVLSALSPNSPTAAEIAKAVKEEIAPQIKNNEKTNVPPSVSKAKKETPISSVDQFNSNFGQKLKAAAEFPGYFQLAVDPSPSSPYSSLIVKTKQEFGTHYYASITMGAIQNVQTMDFMGDICVCIDPKWNGFFIWESEQSQKVWQPIKINSKKHPVFNTLGIYQNGRNISVYINNEFVGDFIKIKDASPSSVGVQIKANRQTGGKMLFQSFAIWEF